MKELSFPELTLIQIHINFDLETVHNEGRGHYQGLQCIVFVKVNELEV